MLLTAGGQAAAAARGGIARYLDAGVLCRWAVPLAVAPNGCCLHCCFHAPWLVLSLRRSQFLYPFVPHSMLAAVQGITTSTRRGWNRQWCFVSAGSSPCFVSVVCSRVTGVARCASLRGSTAQVADVFPCLCSHKAWTP